MPRETENVSKNERCLYNSIKNEFCPNVRKGPYRSMADYGCCADNATGESDDNWLGPGGLALPFTHETTTVSYSRCPLPGVCSDSMLTMKRLPQEKATHAWCFLIPPRMATPCVVAEPSGRLSTACSASLNAPILLCFDSKCACNDLRSGAACAQTLHAYRLWPLSPPLRS